jgi:hypothetical protein
MGRVRYSWRKTCASALKESDQARLLGCIECVITALEKRYAEWGSDPGSQAELIAIQNAICALECLMNKTLASTWRLAEKVADISDAVQHGLANERGHVPAARASRDGSENSHLIEWPVSGSS